MKRRYYRYLIYFLLAGATGFSVVVVMDIFPWNISVNPNKNRLNDSSLVKDLNNKAFKYRLTDPKITIKLADSALQIARKIKYLPGMAEAYRVSGLGFSYLENYSLSMKNYIEALRYFNQLRDDKNIARTYINIGNLYRNSDPDKSLQYFGKALIIAKRVNDEELGGGIYFNIGMAYSKKADYKNSLASFDKGYKVFKKLGDTVSMAIYLQNTGRLYHYMKQTAQAKSRLFEAIRLAKKFQLYTTLSGCYLSLSYIYLDQKEYKLAEESIFEGQKYSKFLENAVMVNDFVRVNYELELRKRNFEKALKYLSLAYHNDSLLLNENQSANIDFNAQHYLQQQKIQENELVITKQKYREATLRWIITLGVLIILLITITGLLFYSWKEKRRKKKELADQSTIASLEQKALQAMMNPHFVFNVMNSIQHFINQADVKSANQILSGFARLARKHLELCMNTMISVQDELVYLRLYLSLEKIRFSEKLKYEILIDENIDTDEIVIPSMLVQPFLENAIWHGIMPKEDGGEVTLNFQLDDSDLLITIVDNGMGINNSENMAKSGHISRGMALIKERVNLLNRLNKRHIFIDLQQLGDFGTRVSIRIPA